MCLDFRVPLRGPKLHFDLQSEANKGQPSVDGASAQQLGACIHSVPAAAETELG